MALTVSELIAELQKIEARGFGKNMVCDTDANPVISVNVADCLESDDDPEHYKMHADGVCVDDHVYIESEF